MARYLLRGLPLWMLIWTSTFEKSAGKQNEMMYGKCETYVGSTCKDILKGKNIYMKRYLNQRALETRISTWLNTAKKTRSVSDSCWPHAKVLICFHTFPVCSSSKVMPSNTPFCQDECKYLETNVCRKEFMLARSISAISHFVPSCGKLPRPGTPGYATCRRLPSLDKSNYPRGLSVAYQRNCTARLTERASLKCYFKLYNLGRRSQEPIRMTWYKDGKSVLKRGGKYRMKRRKRGEFRIISTLIIKSVIFNDSGYYHCVAKQGKKTVKSGVFLSVIKRRKKVDRQATSVRNTQDRDTFSSGLGRCVPYKGTACAKYLKNGDNSYIFEYSYSPQSSVEKRLLREFRKLNETGPFSKKCEDLGRAIMCYNVFNACNKSANSPVSRLCQDDCHLFDKVYCKHEVEMARKHSSAFEFLPDCSLLPYKNALCKQIDSPLIRSQDTGKNDTQCYKGVGKDYNGRVNVSKSGHHCKPWKNFSNVYKFPHNYCRNYGGENFAPWCYVKSGEKEFCSISRCFKLEIKPTVSEKSCYVGKGEDYHGLVKVSMSDRLCLRWSMMGSYTARHNFCRNYGGTKLAPWCYVSKTEKEYCDIPKCMTTARTADSQSPSLVYYVIPVAIALSVLLLVVLVLLVYLKHRKKVNEDALSRQLSRDPSQAVGTLEKDGSQAPRMPGPMDKVSRGESSSS